MKTPFVYTLLLTSILVACSPSDKKDPLLAEATQYHQQATDIQAVVEPQIEQIDSLKTILSAQKTAAAQARATTLDSLKAAFADWEENLVEVPGMPHNHTHEHGEHHHHTDATLKDLPAEQMRDLQHETLKSIQQIQSRLDAVTKSI
ncbi:hypothetical protein [Spirosoma lituiforme]